MINELLAETESLLEGGNLPDAVRTSGEALAQADALWREKYNSQSIREHEISTLLTAGAMHCLTLFLAQEWKECVTTAVMLDYIAALDGVEQRSVAPQLLRLRNLALTALLNLLENMPGSDDAVVRGHVSEIMRYLLALTYSSFSAVAGTAPADIDSQTRTALARSKETMEFMLRNGMSIESPEVQVCGKAVDPERPMELHRDLLGRMRAIGLLAVE